MQANTATQPALPPIVSREEWLVARKRLLALEKENTRQRDAVNAARRRLPMVKIEKSYRFTGADGPTDLCGLFAGRTQLYLHHFMWFADRQAFCQGCTAAAKTGFDNPQFRQSLDEVGVRFVAVSRAPLDQITAYVTKHGWTFPWYSSEGSDFNYDFHTTLDETRAPIEYNYRNKEELLAAGFKAQDLKEDWTVNSVFLRNGNDVYHTYSAFARGLDQLALTHNFLDLTPYGRQQDWEDSPAGWPQRPTYG